MKRLVILMGITDYFGVPSPVAINKADINLARSEELATFCADLRIEVVGRVPYDNVVTEAMVHGFPVTEYTNGPVAEAIEQDWAQTRTRLLSGGNDPGAGI